MQNTITGFTCSFPNCDKTYSTSNNLNRHIQSFHQQLKPFPCPICPKRLVAKANLRDHLYIHNGYKPFECPDCNRRFRQSSQLLKHQRRYKNKLCAIRAGLWDIKLSTMVKNEEELRKATPVSANAVQIEATEPIVLPLIRTEAPSSDSEEPKLPSCTQNFVSYLNSVRVPIEEEIITEA